MSVGCHSSQSATDRHFASSPATDLASVSIDSIKQPPLVAGWPLLLFLAAAAAAECENGRRLEAAPSISYRYFTVRRLVAA
jgi:hypothetical protein